MKYYTESVNQTVTCITAPLFVVKAACRRRRDESRNQLKATENRWDLRCLVNWDTDVAERIASGREFQILGAVTRKARAAVVVDVLGMASKPASDERSRRLGTCRLWSAGVDDLVDDETGPWTSTSRSCAGSCIRQAASVMIVALVLKDYGMVHSRRPEPVNFGLAVDVWCSWL